MDGGIRVIGGFDPRDDLETLLEKAVMEGRTPFVFVAGDRFINAIALPFYGDEGVIAHNGKVVGINFYKFGKVWVSSSGHDDMNLTLTCMEDLALHGSY